MPYVPCVPAWSTCPRAKRVPTSLFLRANVPIYVLTCQKRANFSTQRAKCRANFSFWRANVPKSVLNFQTFLLRNAKGNFYTLLLYKKFYITLDIIVIDMINIYEWYIKIVLYFISILHVILKESVQNFCFLKLFCSSVKNENTKRPAFYTLLVTRVFSNFPQLKQLNKIKNTCEYCDFLQLGSAWIGDPR